MENKRVYDVPQTGFPENKIVLLNGNTLDCFLKACQPEKIISNDMKLDTTGRYLVIGKRKPEPVTTDEKKASQEENRKFFLKNAFFFLRHAHIIMQDSRMFLAPVEINSGLAYMGTNGFKSPTLGVYIEWWLNAKCNIRYDKEGKEALTYFISGSPLSGCNSCSRVYPNGTTQSFSHSSFSSVWHSFVEVNIRYNEAKQIYEQYTLQEVYDRLQHHHDSEESSLKTDLIMRDLRIEELERENASLIERFEKQNTSLRKKLEETKQKMLDLYIKYNQTELDHLRSEFRQHRESHKQEMTLLIEEKRKNKAKLQAGKMSTNEYQKFLKSIKGKRQAFKELEESIIRQIIQEEALDYGVARKWLEGN